MPTLLLSTFGLAILYLSFIAGGQKINREDLDTYVDNLSRAKGEEGTEN